ncbi:MAG: hypothetical protein JWP91_2910 [Fibrobacteres bacterium]|nr:hypothetical protein [Fibrobacterota bacterium]
MHMNPSKPSAQKSPATSGRIETDPSVLGGKPYIRDTRLSVEFLQGLLATGWSASRILEVYQYLADEDLQAMGFPAQATTGHSAAAHGAASQATGLPGASVKDPVP